MVNKIENAIYLEKGESGRWVSPERFFQRLKSILPEMLPARQPGVKRGFTTLQLLELAALATANGLEANRLVPTNPRTGAPIKLVNSNIVPQQLMATIPGLQIPHEVRLRIIDGLVKAGYFNDERGPDAFRARTVEGQQIESLRGAIINYLRQNIAYLAPQYWPQYPQTGILAGKAPSGAALDRALRTSWAWGSDMRTPSLQERYAAVLAVLAQTTEMEPPDVGPLVVGESQQPVSGAALSPRGSPSLSRPISTRILTPAAVPATASLSPRAVSAGGENDIVTPYTAVFGMQDQRPVLVSIRMGMASDPERERMFYVNGGPQNRGRQAILIIKFSDDSVYEYGRVYRNREGMLTEFRNPVFVDRLTTPVSAYAYNHSEDQFQQLLETGYDADTDLIVQEITFP